MAVNWMTKVHGEPSGVIYQDPEELKDHHIFRGEKYKGRNNNSRVKDIYFEIDRRRQNLIPLSPNYLLFSQVHKIGSLSRNWLG
ncbi:hypothetical protein CEXT_25201 [Caerostris extrusa]|uniref:Uncharacterized protein n=1 Tax=Caerostris extrusa TaxID=172846 RepID=A0AAV4NF55_CAEEX|nr:hypothetical protein CEXT_25201 [Caerostris extrusa]